jgi:GT2 family glycosyltransferase
MATMSQTALLLPRSRASRPARARTAPDVTVCIVNWNGREVLRDCLRSLARPQGVRLEVVVVDNGSSDGSADMVAAEFPRVRLIRNGDNRGFSRANNQAAARARGRYLFFLNNDTVVPRMTLRRLLEYVRAHPDVGMVGPRLRDPEGQVQASYRPRPSLGALLHRTGGVRCTGLFRSAYRRYRRGAFDPRTERDVESLMGAALFLPRRVFLQCGPWDEGFAFGGEDLYFSTCVARFYRLVFLPSVEITHVGGVSSRLRAGYVHAGRAAGLARYLHLAGYSRHRVLAFKLAVSLDLPLQLLGKGIEFLWRCLRGRRGDAARSLRAWRAAGHFLARGLPALWRA